jgi:hypothetical protein
MSDPIVYGFPRSTFVNIVRMILTHKDVTYSFHDLEPVMGKPDHLALHPLTASRSFGMASSPSTRRARLPPMSTRPFTAHH